METPFEREMRLTRASTEHMLRVMETFDRLFAHHFQCDSKETESNERAEHAYRLSREPEEGDYINWPETLDEVYKTEG